MNKQSFHIKKLSVGLLCLIIFLPTQPTYAQLGDLIPDIPSPDDLIPDIPDLGDLLPDDIDDLGDLISLPNPLEDLQDIISDKIGQIEDLLEGAIPDIGEVIGGVLTENTGELGIPDLNKAKKEISKKIEEAMGSEDSEIAMQKNDSFNTNAVVLEQSMTHEANRTIARTVAASAISEESQETAKNNLVELAASLEVIKALNQQAQTMDVTQDIMKNYTYIQSEMSKIHYLTYVEVQGLRQILAADLQINADLSEALDEQNRSKHARTLADSNSNLFQATQLQF